MAKRRKKPQEEHVDETWLIPYSDLLTLLLALFIVLFASSSVDAKKFEQMGNAFKKIVEEGAAGNQAYVSKEKGPDDPNMNAVLKAMEEQDKKKEANEQEKAKKAAAALLKKQNEEKIEAFKKQIDSYIAAENLGTKMTTKYSDEGLLITIRDDILFQSGSAELSAGKREIAKEIGELFAQGKGTMEGIVSGHTDNVPISTSIYSSNWELSVARAVNFMEAIIQENSEVNPGEFSARGYGEFRPVAKNDIAANREKNRRVEIMVRPINRDTLDEDE
ncbi:flagellar motor protein MotB [Listeria monocytogenes]|nr:flagellar motor protein MotB [Listeria monocytogenes]EIM0422516.1 flagellar motor protein MotB [Listeria monocytogenes]EIM1137335.1 flagellar motor protein MotB [Listeria monocytogenes]EIM1235258.1 flagellar motor protein MotB [Listeria monocytogenes]